MKNTPLPSRRFGLMLIGVLTLALAGETGIVSAAEPLKPLSKREFQYLLKNARTPLEHAKLSIYYEAKRRVSTTLRHQAREFTDFFPLSPAVC